MRKCMIFLLWLMASSLMAQSKVYDKLILMDGTMLEGRIMVQHPGKDLVFFQEEKQTVYPMEDILAIEHVHRAVDDHSGIDDVIEVTGFQITARSISGIAIAAEGKDETYVRTFQRIRPAAQKKHRLHRLGVLSLCEDRRPGRCHVCPAEGPDQTEL